MKCNRRMLLVCALIMSVCGGISGAEHRASGELNGAGTSATLVARKGLALPPDRVVLRKGSARLALICKNPKDRCTKCICDKLTSSSGTWVMVTVGELKAMSAECGCEDAFGKVVGQFYGGDGEPASYCVP